VQSEGGFLVIKVATGNNPRAGEEIRNAVCGRDTRQSGPGGLSGRGRKKARLNGTAF